MAVSVLRELFRSHRPLFEERRGAASVGTSKLRSDSGINVYCHVLICIKYPPINITQAQVMAE
jgi:hypothetical protein